MIWSCFFVRSGEMNCDFPDGHGFSFLPCFFFNPGGYDQIYSDGSHAKKQHTVWGTRDFSPTEKTTRKNMKELPQNLGGDAFSWCFWGQVFFSDFLLGSPGKFRKVFLAVSEKQGLENMALMWKRRRISTLLETNISPTKPFLKMIFLFPRWDT